MTFPASRRQPLSGNNTYALAALIICFALSAQATPYLQRSPAGTINWTQGVIRVVGVGTPKVLSATAGVTEGDLSRMAKVDAHTRLKEILKTICPGGSAASTKTGRACATSAELGVPENPIRMSDGTIHQAFTLPFSKIGPQGVRSKPTSKDEPTGLLIRLEQPVTAPVLMMQIQLKNGRKIGIGPMSDSLGQNGILWTLRPLRKALSSKLGKRAIRTTGELAASPTPTKQPVISIGLTQDEFQAIPKTATVLISLPEVVDEN